MEMTQTIMAIREGASSLQPVPDPFFEIEDVASGSNERTRRSQSNGTLLPQPPETLEDTGLSEELVGGLVLKALNARGTALGFDLVDTLALPMGVLDGIIQKLQERRYVEVHSTKGPRRGEWVFRLTEAGRMRAAEELEISRYVGPAPVPFEDFVRWVELQTIETARVAEAQLKSSFDGVVLPDAMYELLGPALNSGRSLFLFGDPGNGKTLLAERIARVLGDRYYVPYSVLVDGNVMIVHDPVHHRGETNGHEPPVRRHSGHDELSDILRILPEHDRRFMQANRPVVVTGGELTLEQLDLQWDASGRMYQAPPQLKAAGGVLVVDDLGRQRVPVRELLNRWVVPLEQRLDYLTLRSGRKIVVPFDCFVIFSTNLQPRDLGDEAFLRRIHYKIRVPDPDRGEYEKIFRACCKERDIPYDEGALEYLFSQFYENEQIEPRRCHPRDVLDHLCDLARYRNEPPLLTPELLERACQSYFVPTS